MPVLPTQYRVVGIAIVVVAMAFGVQRWASILQPREGGGSRRQSKCVTTSQDASKTSDKPPQRRTRRNKSGMSFRELRDAWSPRNYRDQSHAVNSPKSNVAIDFILSPELQRAISQSRYPVQVMPDVSEQPDLLMDLDFLTLDDKNDHAPPQYSPRGYYSPRHSPSRDALRDKSRSPSIEPGHVMMITSPSSSRSNSYTRAVQEWERVHQEQYLAKQNIPIMPAPLTIRKNSADSLYDEAGFWISPTPTPEYEPNAFPFRDSIRMGTDYQSLASGKRRPARQSQGQEPRYIKRIRLHHQHEQSVPEGPSVTYDDVSYRHKADSGVGSDFGAKDAASDDQDQLPSRHRPLRSSSVYSSDDAMMEDPRQDNNVVVPIDAELSSEPAHDTTVHETVAPAVTHETIIEDTPEIKQEVITRDIHTHDVYHRVLPIVDIEVLPSRHFLADENDPSTLHELPPTALPALRQQIHSAMTTAAATILPPPPPVNEIPHPRKFTARDFPGTEGDATEYVTPEGVKRTEQWWVHPPTLDDTAQLAGKTEAFHFDHPDGRDDGFRAGIPSSSSDVVANDGGAPSARTVPAATPAPKPVLKRYVSGSTETAAAAAAVAAARIHDPSRDEKPVASKGASSPSQASSVSSPSTPQSGKTAAKLKALPLRILEKFS